MNGKRRSPSYQQRMSEHWAQLCCSASRWRSGGHGSLRRNLRPHMRKHFARPEAGGVTSPFRRWRSRRDTVEVREARSQGSGSHPGGTGRTPPQPLRRSFVAFLSPLWSRNTATALILQDFSAASSQHNPPHRPQRPATTQHNRGTGGGSGGRGWREGDQLAVAVRTKLGPARAPAGRLSRCAPYVVSSLIAPGGPWRGKKKTGGGLGGNRAGCRSRISRAPRVMAAYRHAGANAVVGEMVAEAASVPASARSDVASERSGPWAGLASAPRSCARARAREGGADRGGGLVPRCRDLSPCNCCGSRPYHRRANPISKRSLQEVFGRFREGFLAGFPSRRERAVGQPSAHGKAVPDRGADQESREARRQGTGREPLLPTLLPNSVAQAGTQPDEERFETAKPRQSATFWDYLARTGTVAAGHLDRGFIFGRLARLSCMASGRRVQCGGS